MIALRKQAAPAQQDVRVVAVVDGDDAARAATTSTMRRAGHVVYAFALGETFLAATLPDAVECVLLADREGFALLPLLRARADAPTAIVTSASDRWESAVAALKAGAADYLVMPVGEEALLRAVEDACAQRRTRAAAIDPAACAIVAALPRREREVLRAVALGKPTKVIAHELGLSARTVETYRSKLNQKIGESTAVAVRLAAAAGLI